MSKEVILTKQDIKDFLGDLELEKSKKRLGYVISATAAAGTVKVIHLVTPTVVTAYASSKAFVTGSTYFIGMSVPNMTFILMALLVFSATYSKFMIEHEKIKAEKEKNNNTDNIFKLED